MNQTSLALLATLCVSMLGHSAEPVVGGYAKASVSDEPVVATANFAVQARSALATKTNPQKVVKLLKILSAEQQVVAGTNYQLKLRVEEAGTRRTVVATVWWQPWRKPDPYKLTSWK